MFFKCFGGIIRVVRFTYKGDHIMTRCIVIDREYGSGGREVAKILSQKLGIKFYDGEQLVAAAKERNMEIGNMRDYDEKGVGSFLQNMALAFNTSNGVLVNDQPYKAFDAVAKVITTIGMEEDSIFLGRCAKDLLEGKAEVLNIFIYATDVVQKIKRAEEVDHIEAKNVSQYIKRKDQERSNYYRHFTEKEWGDKENYDLCLNTSTLGYEKAAQIIMDIYNK